MEVTVPAKYVTAYQSDKTGVCNHQIWRFFNSVVSNYCSMEQQLMERPSYVLNVKCFTADFKTP
jgi:hypothetical protein